MSNPERTCIGCRAKDSPENLVRLVCTHHEGESTPIVVFDVERKLPGRGAWIHHDSACLEYAHRKGAFNRAFRTRVKPHELVIPA